MVRDFVTAEGFVMVKDFMIARGFAMVGDFVANKDVEWVVTDTNLG